MRKNTSNSSTSFPSESKFVMIILVLSGLLLFAGSFFIKHEGIWISISEFIKELGIVILAVFSISLIYELTIARKYLNQFTSLLRAQIEQGESNGAECAHLGIQKIFKTRDKFELEYPLSNTISSVSADSEIRIVAVSLFLIMSKADLIKEALTRGCKIELALFDPESPHKDLEKIQDLEIHDIEAAINVFRKLIDWTLKTKPSGSIELRYHKVTLFDSFSYFKTTNKEFCIWDLSFGRDTTKKRIFVLDPSKPLGIDLTQRYKRIWETGESRFLFSNNTAVNYDYRLL
jgi:hypothetical protein